MKLPEIPTSVTVIVLMLIITGGIIAAQVTNHPIPDFLTISFTSVVSYVLGRSAANYDNGGKNADS